MHYNDRCCARIIVRGINGHEYFNNSCWIELLLGQIANTNGQYLSRLFNSIGKSVVEHTVIGDNPQRLEYVIKEGLKRFDTLVFTGGLGPTKMT